MKWWSGDKNGENEFSNTLFYSYVKEDIFDSQNGINLHNAIQVVFHYIKHSFLLVE
jgi:hypothetical protein